MKAIEAPSTGTDFCSDVCVWFPSIWVVYGLHSILSNLIAICQYLPRCLLFKRCCTLYNKVIMLSPLIFSMLIYIFLLFHIITFCILFGEINLISGRFCLFGMLQPLGFSLHLLNPHSSIASIVFVLFIRIISLYWLTLSRRDRRANFFLCSPFILDYILIFHSDVHLTQSFFFSLFWDAVEICVFLAS